MLNELTDDVLCHILSFLPTKTSVSTSLLAKRWRFLWAHVPNLEFNGDNFGLEPQPLDIISRVVLLHQAKVVNTFSFRLTALNGCAYRLLALITHLIKRNVRNLYLEFCCSYEFGDIACTLPGLLSTCKTLVDLKLVRCGVISSSGELFLPSLKKLYLKYVEYEDDESLSHLLSGCPVLEELIVNDCHRAGQNNLGCVIVSSPTVKTLIVNFAHGRQEYCTDEMLRIDVPGLVYLKVDRCYLERVRSLRENMTSLIEVDIALTECRHYRCTKRTRSIEIPTCLCNVKCLKITCDSQLNLVRLVGTGSTPMFVNLTKLQLDFTVDSNHLVKFLEVADNLEFLIINLSKTLPYKEPKRVPSCMLSSLRTVRMYNFSACEDAFETVRYVLMNARALEKMEIHVEDGSSDKEKLGAFRRISLFERGSMACQLAFNNAD